MHWIEHTSFQLVQCIANELQHNIIKTIKEHIFSKWLQIELFNKKLISKTQIHRVVGYDYSYMRVWKNMPCVTQSLSLGDNWVSPEQNSFQHNYTMNNGEMVIRTKDIANCPAVSTRRNDVEDAYYTGLHLYLYMHALTLVNKTKQNTTQKQTTTKKARNVHLQMNWKRSHQISAIAKLPI